MVKDKKRRKAPVKPAKGAKKASGSDEVEDDGAFGDQVFDSDNASQDSSFDGDLTQDHVDSEGDLWEDLLDEDGLAHTGWRRNVTLAKDKNIVAKSCAATDIFDGGLKFLTAGHSMNALMKRVSAPIPNHADH
jgi:hypothetical protein